jgi:RIO kinase 1
MQRQQAPRIARGLCASPPIAGATTLTQTLIPQDDIESFFDEGYIVDVLFEVKSGKEATVYCAQAHPDRPERYYALKYYRPQAHRAFRNDAIYQEGRYGHETREVRAMRTKTRKGRAFQFGGWLAHEYAMLMTLHAAGVDVPRPIALGTHGLLIEFIGAETTAAPMLGAVRFARGEAEPVFKRLLGGIATMLAQNVVHGDLSAYNILYQLGPDGGHEGGRPVIIDLPQAVDARNNQNAQMLLTRDITNVCGYFTRQRVICDPVKIADDLWDRYARGKL